MALKLKVTQVRSGINRPKDHKLTLKGLLGPIEVRGRAYAGQVPMLPLEEQLDDEEIAAVLTYVRNAFGHEASAISPEKVKEVRAAIQDRTELYSPAELLEEHPHGDATQQ